MNTSQEIYRLQDSLSLVFDSIGITQEIKDNLTFSALSAEELNQLSLMVEKFDQIIENQENKANLQEMFNQRLIIRLGNFHYDQDNLTKALKYYELANNINESEWAYYNSGKILLEINKPWKAFDQFDQAIKIKPDFAKAIRNQGLILKDMNQLEEAVIKLKRSQKINPNDLKTNKTLAKIYIQKGEKKEALIQLKMIQKKYPEEEGVLEEIKKLEKGKSFFTGVLIRFRKNK